MTMLVVTQVEPVDEQFAILAEPSSPSWMDLMKWIALILMFSFTSCGKLPGPSSVKISLLNQSTTPARLMLSNGKDSVVIDADGNSSLSKHLIFSESLTQDGSYKLQFSTATKDTSYSFGYYTNGSALDEEFQFTWTSDSLKLKRIPTRY
ncbi:MAG TPA: hypothetical protein VGD22_16580 [Sphingobacteriaceae bacterium]